MTEPRVNTRALWTDAQVEQFVGTLLRTGVIAAAVVTAVGGIMLLLQHGATVADYREFHGEPASLTSLSNVLGGAAHFEALAIVQLGLIILIATPIARVALTLIAFIFQRDRLYTAITAIVLAVLAFGLLLGGRL